MIHGWREASKCTTANSQYENSNEKLSSQSLIEENSLSLSTNVDHYFANSNAQNTNNINDDDDAQNLLELNCGTDLIFIASSHFGQRNSNRYGKKEGSKLKNNNLFYLNNNRKNSSTNNDNG